MATDPLSTASQFHFKIGQPSLRKKWPALSLALELESLCLISQFTNMGSWRRLVGFDSGRSLHGMRRGQA